jgi:hypothetical protein
MLSWKTLGVIHSRLNLAQTLYFRVWCAIPFYKLIGGKIWKFKNNIFVIIDKCALGISEKGK